MTWRRILFLTAGILLLLLVASWIVLQQTGAVRAFVQTALRQVLSAPFQLADAELSVTEGTLTLHGFAVRHPRRSDGRLLDVERARLSVATGAAGELVALHAAELEGVDLLVDLVEGGLPRLDELLRVGAGTGGGVDLPDRLPIVSLRRSRAEVRVMAGLPALELADLELDLAPGLDADGRTDRRVFELVGRANLVNAGLPLQLRGHFDLAANDARLQVEVTDARIDAALLQQLRPLLPEPMADLEATAAVPRLTLWLHLPGSGADAGHPLLGIDAEFQDVSCRTAALPVPCTGARVRLSGDSGNGGGLHAILEQAFAGGSVTANCRATGLATTPRFEVRGTAHGIRIDESVRAVLQMFAVGRAVVDGLQPTEGLADIDLFLRDPGADDELVDLDLDLRGVALAYHGFGNPQRRVAFPLPVVDARGHVHVRNDVIAIENVTARLAPAAGGGDITMSGRVQPRRDRDDLVSIDLDAPRVEFTPELRAALGRLLRDDGALWDQFAPRGAAAVTLRVRAGHDQDSDWQVRVQPAGAEVTWTRFPWRLHDVTGLISAQDQGLQFDLTGRHGSATLRAHGRLLAPAGRPGAITNGRIELLAEAAGVPLDADLRLATTTLMPDLDRLWEDLQPAGGTGATVAIARADAGAPMVWDLRLDVAGASATPAFLPLPVQDLHGPVYVTGDGDGQRVDLEALRGLIVQDDHRAELALVGSVHTQPHREDLTAVVRDLRLDEPLARALDHAGALAPATWQTLRPSGTVDVACHHERRGDGPPEHRLTVFLRDVASDACMLPRRATQVVGEVQIAGGVVTFEQVRARVGDVPVTCARGHVRPVGDDGSAEVAFTIAAEHFPANDDLARLFSGPLHQTVLDRQLRGTLRIHELDLRFLVPGTGSDQPFSTTLKGRIEASGLDALLGTRLESVSAWLQIDESTIDTNGGTLRGTFSRGSMRLLGQPWNAVQAGFAADAQRIVLNDLQAELHGGIVRGHDAAAPAIEYLFAGPEHPHGRLGLDLDIERVRLQDFLTACGLVGTPYRGSLGGRFHLLALNGSDLVNMHAEGELAVTDGDLGTVPLFTAIYALMAESNRPRFEGVASRFTLRDRVLQLDDLAVTSPLIAVTGSGSMTMEGYLDVVVTLDSLFGGSADMLLLPPLVQVITSGLVRFHLFGHLRDLRAEQRWFAERNPRRTQLLPVPPRADRPVRPGF